MRFNISHLTSVCVCACVRACMCVCESEWVCEYFFVYILCVQIQPRALPYANCWQINPGNPDLRRQSEEVRLIIHTPTGLSLSLTHTLTHTRAQVCVSLGVIVCVRVTERQEQIEREGKKERVREK